MIWIMNGVKKNISRLLDYIKEKPLQLLNLKEFSKFMLPNLA